MTLSLEQFRAPRREVTDLGEAICDDALAEFPGFIYLDALYIEHYRDGYHLLIGRDTQVSSDLGAFEQRLYDFALSEGYCDVDTFRMTQIKQSGTFRKWFSKLRDKRARALIAMRLEDGNAGDVAAVGDGVSELRIDHGAGYRVYFQRRGAIVVVLLCGGDKSTQGKDIRTAKKIAAEWSDDNG